MDEHLFIDKAHIANQREKVMKRRKLKKVPKLILMILGTIIGCYLMMYLMAYGIYVNAAQMDQRYSIVETK